MLPGADPKKVVQALTELRGLTRKGELYVPTGRYLAYNPQTSSAWAHGLTALLGMLSTLEANVSGKRERILLERAAINPRFPVHALDKFHADLKGRAGEFLFTVDREMGRYERRRRSDSTTRLGVCVFAYEEPRITGVVKRGRASGTPRRRSS